MAIETWDEIRTAWHVARAGTVSGAAETLGVHHATVIRHIDALESRLGLKLFQRHARGYTPTEAGAALAQVGRTTEDQFAQLSARLSGLGEGIGGELVVTSVPELADVVMPTLCALMAAYPDLRLRYLTDRRLFRLEYGEAHLALRAGAQPSEPDNVVQPLTRLPTTVFAAPDYLARHGTPVTLDDLGAHRFVVDDGADSRAPFFRWLTDTHPQAIPVLRANDFAARIAAMRGGAGMGFLFAGCEHPGLVRVMDPIPEWDVPIWLVTHVDLHRTPKVQAAAAALKAAFA